MKFRNLSDDARVIPALRLTVEPGDTTPDLTPEEAEGFAGQVDVWAEVETPTIKTSKTTTTAKDEV